MRKFRFYIGVIRLFIRRFIIYITIGVLFGVAIFLTRDQIFFLDLFASPQRIGVVGRSTPETLPLSILKKISMGLTKLGADGSPQPDLAKKWESADDGRKWIFELGEYRWQDGSKIKSEDIKYSFPDVTTTTTDQNHIEFSLKDPYAAFPVLVSRPIFKKRLIGNGDWTVKKINFDNQYISELTIEKNKTNRREIYRFYLSEQALRTAFQLGEIDKILDISDPKELANWENGAGVKITFEPNRFVGLFFNTEDQYLSDKTVRQALAYAIDKEKLGEKRAISPLSPASWAFNALGKPYEYSPERAKTLLAQIKKDQRPQKLTVVTIPSLLAKAEAIAENWKVIGIETSVWVAPGVPQEFQALLATQEIPPDPDQYPLWHSTQKETNVTHYNNPRIDKLLEDGRKTLDQQERKRIYLDFQRFLAEDSPVVFLYHPISYSISRR